MNKFLKISLFSITVFSVFPVVSCNPKTEEQKIDFKPDSRIINYKLVLDSEKNINDYFYQIDDDLFDGEKVIINRSSVLNTDNQHLYVSNDKIVKKNYDTPYNGNSLFLGRWLEYTIDSEGYNNQYGSYVIDTPIFYNISETEMSDLSSGWSNFFWDNNAKITNKNLSEITSLFSDFILKKGLFQDIKYSLCSPKEKDALPKFHIAILDWWDNENGIGSDLRNYIKDSNQFKNTLIGNIEIKSIQLFCDNSNDITMIENKEPITKKSTINISYWNNYNVFADNVIDMKDLNEDEMKMSTLYKMLKVVIDSNSFISIQKKHTIYENDLNSKMFDGLLIVLSTSNEDSNSNKSIQLNLNLPIDTYNTDEWNNEFKNFYSYVKAQKLNSLYFSTKMDIDHFNNNIVVLPMYKSWYQIKINF